MRYGIQWAIFLCVGVIFSADGLVAKDVSLEKSSDAPTPSEPNVRISQEEADRLIKAAKERRLEKAREVMKVANRPIEFFGVVLDQDKKPVVGAKVTASVKMLREPVPGFIGEIFKPLESVTDAEGKFVFRGIEGELLCIDAIQLDGYLKNSKDTRRGYWYLEEPEHVYKPSPTKPEVFRMWKQAGAEQLVNGVISKRLGNVPEFKTFNLFTGKEDQEGDLKVRVWSTPRIPPKFEYGKLADNPGDFQRFRRETLSWDAEIEVVDGGVQEMEHDEIYLAPEQGYKPKWSFHQAMDKNPKRWTDTRAVDLFIHFRGKYYGRMKIEFSMKANAGQSDRSGVRIEYFLNPSGSQNLEYDSGKHVNVNAYDEDGVKLLNSIAEEQRKRRQEQKEKIMKEGEKS